MKFGKLAAITALLFSGIANSEGDIAFGKILAIKHYDLNSTKLIKLYLHTNDNKNSTCLEQGMSTATITFTQHDEAAINRMLSMAMSAQMAGKSIRLYSENNTCENDLIGIQDSYF